MQETKRQSSKRMRVLYDHLSEDHRRLMEMVNQVQASSSNDVLRKRLEELHEILMAHFAQETYPDGFYQAMGACAPEHAYDLRVLVDEHFRILSRLWGIKERVHPDESAISTPIADEVAGLAMMLAEHERQEHELALRLMG